MDDRPVAGPMRVLAEVTVYCDDGPAHATKGETIIKVWKKKLLVASVPWSTTEPLPFWTGKDTHGGPDSTWSTGLAGPEPHTTENFRCKLCGLKEDIRTENLHPILDGLADNGVRRISLHDLRRLR
jgi:hypothetical protein